MSPYKHDLIPVSYLFMTVFLPHLIQIHAYVPTIQNGPSFSRPGDFILGGLIPLHTDRQCNELRSLGSFKLVEAMAYAVERINDDPTLLPNITLGFEIRDTCSNIAIALQESLNLVSTMTTSCSSVNDSCLENDRGIMIGVVGARRSSSSRQAAILFGLHHVPQISYLSTSDELGDKERYPYFLRTVGPDSFQVNVIVDIIKQYKWNYVSFLNSDDTYGKSAQHEFKTLAAEYDICIGVMQTISSTFEEGDYDKTISELMDLRSNTYGSVVVVFVHLEMARAIFRAAMRADAKRTFIWIGSDGIGNFGLEAVKGFEEVTVGSFTISPFSETLEDFNKYFRSLTPASSNNPWLLKFLEKFDPCGKMSSLNPCDNVTLTDIDQNDTVHETLVMDAVYAFAHGLQDMCENDWNACLNKDMFDRGKLLQHLLNVSFVSLANGHIRFTSNGDSFGRYTVRHLQEFKDGMEFVPVGIWKGNDSSRVIPQPLPWYLEDDRVDDESGVPLSVCSLPCDENDVRHVNPDSPCCWTCEKCRDSEIPVHNISTCVSCLDSDDSLYRMPNENLTACVEIDVQRNVWTIGIVTISVFGLLFAIFMFSCYVYHREKTLIKATGRDLSYLIFIGIFLAYITALLLGIFRLTKGVCIIQRLGAPLSMSLIYVSIAVKTIRLYRIFKASVKSARRPKFIEPRFQIAISLLLTGVLATWVIVWMISDVHPTVEIALHVQSDSERFLQITCIQSKGETIGAMVWNIATVLVCCIFAFLTRKLPENYKETKFIMFCSFCAFVIEIAFSSTYFTIRDAYSRSGYSALGLIVNATVTLVCLYTVKIYAIYFADPEEVKVKFHSKSLRRNSSYVQSTSRNRSSVVETTVDSTTRSELGTIRENQQEKSSGFASMSSQSSSSENQDLKSDKDRESELKSESSCSTLKDTTPAVNSDCSDEVNDNQQKL